MKKTHHTTNLDEFCFQCKRSFIWEWYDKEEKNGRMERKYGFEPKQICVDCMTKNNKGRPPLGLKDLNEIRRRKITKDQYYKELGL